MTRRITLGISLLAILHTSITQASDCNTSNSLTATELATKASSISDPLESSLALMQALRICKKYEWWMELGQLQEQQSYWHEAADAYERASDFYKADLNGEMFADEIRKQAAANHRLAVAYWKSEQQAKAITTLEETRAGYEVLGEELPLKLINFQGKVDDTVSSGASARLLSETLNLQRTRSTRGIGTRPKLKQSETPTQTELAASSSKNTAIDTESSQTQARLNLQILFDIGSDQVAETSMNSIDVMASAIDQLTLTTDQSLTLVGHTDSTGSASRNFKLSEQRAESVRKILLNKITNAVEITALGKGESQLRYPGTSADAHRRNRRVEVLIIDSAQQ